MLLFFILSGCILLGQPLQMLFETKASNSRLSLETRKLKPPFPVYMSVTWCYVSVFIILTVLPGLPCLGKALDYLLQGFSERHLSFSGMHQHTIFPKVFCFPCFTILIVLFSTQTGLLYHGLIQSYSSLHYERLKVLNIFFSVLHFNSRVFKLLFFRCHEQHQTKGPKYSTGYRALPSTVERGYRVEKMWFLPFEGFQV